MLDLSDWSVNRLREFCREQDLYAGGRRWELEARICEVLSDGAVIEVLCVDGWRQAVILDCPCGDILELACDGQTLVYSLQELTLRIEDPDEVERPRTPPGGAADLTADAEAAFATFCQYTTRGEYMGPKELRSWAASAGAAFTKKEAAELIRSYDCDGDGRLEAVEFVLLYKDLIGGEDEGEDPAASTEEEEEEEEEVEDDLCAGMAGMHMGGYGVRPNKRALIVGSSYPGSRTPLPGTLNDAADVHSLLAYNFGFSEDGIQVLTDDSGDRFRLPTRRNILKGFEWLLRDVQPGDSLFFYFSGHGSSERCAEEPSGYCQSILPCDWEEEGAIPDSLINKLLVKPLPMGVTLHALIDSCHSGTAMNLPYNALLSRGRFKGWEEEYPGKGWKMSTAGGLAVQFSAARHDQLANEACMSGRRSRANGAATYAFVQAIQQHKGVWGFEILYDELLSAMYEALAGSRFKEQEPTISASTAFDLTSHRIKLRL